MTGLLGLFCVLLVVAALALAPLALVVWATKARPHGPGAPGRSGRGRSASIFAVAAGLALGATVLLSVRGSGDFLLHPVFSLPAVLAGAAGGALAHGPLVRASAPGAALLGALVAVCCVGAVAVGLAVFLLPGQGSAGALAGKAVAAALYMALRLVGDPRFGGPLLLAGAAGGLAARAVAARLAR
jgi:hypothetical protein